MRKTIPIFDDIIVIKVIYFISLLSINRYNIRLNSFLPKILHFKMSE